jgi:hypothetical protein
MKMGRSLFDVDGDGMEILIDAVRDLLTGVRFGLQPNATTSGWRGAEIEQDWPPGGFSLSQRSIRIFDPLHGHIRSFVQKFYLDFIFGAYREPSVFPACDGAKHRLCEDFS